MPDGLTTRQHLIKVWEKTGSCPKELAEHSECPVEFQNLLLWHDELTSPLTFIELEAWSHLTKRRLEVWEIKILFRLDAVRRG